MVIEPRSTRVRPTPCVESLHDNFGQVICSLSEVATTMQVYMDEKKIHLKGSIMNRMTYTWEGDCCGKCAVS